MKLMEDILIINYSLLSLLNKIEPKTYKYLYDSYKLLSDTIRTSDSLINGHLSSDLSFNFYETESFPSPMLKWIHYTSEELKNFNDTLLKYLRSLWRIKFDNDELVINLSRFSIFKPYNEHDNKILLSKDGNEIIYTSFLFDNPNTMFKDTEKKVLSYSIDKWEEKSELINRIKLVHYKMIENKLYIENFLINNVTIKDLVRNHKSI